MNATQELTEKSATLPEPLAREVLDFLLFIASRHRGLLQSTSEDPSPRGALKGCLSSSSAFASRKHEEKKLER
jgi:hypothetical protein